MREIEFRGFNRKNKKWLYGFYLQNHGAHFVCPDEFDGKLWDDYEIDPDSLGEFTGLFDKNKHKIYEGDIVDGIPFPGRHVIRYDFGEWLAVDAKREWIELLVFASECSGVLDTIEVFGNIYDCTTTRK